MQSCTRYMLTLCYRDSLSLGLSSSGADMSVPRYQGSRASHEIEVCIQCFIYYRQIVRVGDSQKIRVFLEFVTDTDTLVASCRDEWLAIYDQEVKNTPCMYNC